MFLSSNQKLIQNNCFSQLKLFTGTQTTAMTFRDRRIQKLHDYSGPKDKAFVADTFENLIASEENISEYTSSELLEIFAGCEEYDFRKKQVRLLAQTCAEFLCKKETTPFSLLNKLYKLCRHFDDQNFSSEHLRDSIEKYMEQEFSRLQSKAESIKENPSACALTILGDADALRQYLHSTGPRTSIKKMDSRKGPFSFLKKKEISNEESTERQQHSLLEIDDLDNYAEDSCLMIAIQQGNKKCIEVIFEAVKKAPQAVVEKLLNHKNEDGYTAMSYAIKATDIYSVEHLLELGEDVMEQTIGLDELISPMELICEKAARQPLNAISFLEDTLNLLEKDKSFDINKPIRHAPGSDESCKLIDVAAKYVCVDVLEVLIRHGARPTGIGLIKMLRRGPQLNILRFLRLESMLSDDEFDREEISVLACMKAILDVSPEAVSWKDENEETPLHHAVYRRSEAFVEFLLNHGAQTTARNSDNQTPLQVASQLEYSDIERLLQRTGLLRRLVSSRSNKGESFKERTQNLPDHLLCVICRDRPREVWLAPCGHKILCRRDTKRLLEGDPESCKCPCCSETIESFITKTFE